MGDNPEAEQGDQHVKDACVALISGDDVDLLAKLICPVQTVDTKCADRYEGRLCCADFRR